MSQSTVFLPIAGSLLLLPGSEDLCCCVQPAICLPAVGCCSRTLLLQMWCCLVSHVWLFATLWTTACQASLSFTISQSLLKLMSIELVMSSNHLVLSPFSSCLQSFLASGSLLMSQLFASGGQSVGASASASVLPMNIQDWFPLGLIGLISLLSKGLSRVFSNTTVWEGGDVGVPMADSCWCMTENLKILYSNYPSIKKMKWQKSINILN